MAWGGGAEGGGGGDEICRGSYKEMRNEYHIYRSRNSWQKPLTEAVVKNTVFEGGHDSVSSTAPVKTVA
jgi:hypothetical protein